MKIITSPTVHVVGATQFFGHPKYKIPRDGDQSVQMCAFAAKGCYDSYGEDGNANERNQDTIVSSGHGSVLEHYSVSLFIEGVTRGLTLELNRHRHFAISQRSTRYTREDESAIVLDPYYAAMYNRWGDMMSHRLKERERWEYTIISEHIAQCQRSLDEYINEVEWLIKANPEGLKGVALRKWARGKARNILPHALETRGTWTGNIRAWRHFLETRSSRYAEPEIRRLTHHVYKALSLVIPFYLKDYELVEVQGYPEFTTSHRKV